jgi:hypothetical protein
MRVMDLPDWPPSTFAMVGSGRGDRVPTHAEQVIVGNVLETVNACVRFNCDFENRNVVCSFYAPDAKTAEKLAAILKSRSGKNLFNVGPIQIPQDED